MALNPGSLLPPARDPPFPTSCTNKTYCLSCFLAKFSHLILTEGTSTAGLTLMSVLNSATAQAFSPSKEKWPRGCYGFSSSLVWMRELDHKKGWSVKNWCFQTVVLEKTLEGPVDCKEIKPVNPKKYQPWIFIGRTDTETEIPILWPPDVKSQFIGKDPDTGKDRRQEKGMTEDEMVGWCHQLNGHEFE